MMTRARRAAIGRAVLKLSKRMAAIASDLRLALAEAEGIRWADDLVLDARDLASRLEESALDVDRGRREFSAADEPELPLFDRPAAEKRKPPVPTCRVCKCTDADCRRCIEKTGEPCHRIEPDLCSACWAGPLKLEGSGPSEPDPIRVVITPAKAAKMSGTIGAILNGRAKGRGGSKAGKP